MPVELPRRLTGLVLPGGWRVLAPLALRAAAPGGISWQGYLVESADGVRAFLKALDYSAAVPGQPLTPRATTQQTVDQQFHGVGAVADQLRVLLVAVGVGQQEVIHAADAGDRITHAGGHAGSEHGDENFVRLRGDEVFPGEHFHHPMRVCRIEEFPGRNGAAAIDDARIGWSPRCSRLAHDSLR